MQMIVAWFFEVSTAIAFSLAAVAAEASKITPKSEPKYSIHSIVTVLLRDGSSST